VLLCRPCRAGPDTTDSHTQKEMKKRKKEGKGRKRKEKTRSMDLGKLRW